MHLHRLCITIDGKINQSLSALLFSSIPHMSILTSRVDCTLHNSSFTQSGHQFIHFTQYIVARSCVEKMAQPDQNAVPDNLQSPSIAPIASQGDESSVSALGSSASRKRRRDAHQETTLQPDKRRNPRTSTAPSATSFSSAAKRQIGDQPESQHCWNCGTSPVELSQETNFIASHINHLSNATLKPFRTLLTFPLARGSAF